MAAPRRGGETPAQTVRAVALVLCLWCAAACSRQGANRSPLPPHVSGTLAVSGVEAPVRIVRDRRGVPHLYAENQGDLFFAQGWVQAQDRLFQMDLWRRAAQGRLSEVLGANFIERDAMTRRVQYRGDSEAEWASYGPDTRAIAEAFVRGVNAWIDLVGERPPQEFALAGWRPEHWSARDLLNRTDAFVMSGNASDEVFRARLAAAAGARATDRLTAGMFSTRLEVPRELDVNTVAYVIGDALKEVGTAPFFSGLAGPVPSGSNAWAVDGAHSTTGAPLLAADPHRALDHPSARYLVQLTAPGWHVIGATSPWLPGVVIGHNDRVAWAMSSRAADVQDIYVERVNPANPHQVELAGRWVNTTIVPDPIAVKGKARPFPFERESTPHGVIIASDRERHLAFTLRWTGFEPGGAAELGALTLDRAQTAGELQTALDRWKLPAATFVYATKDDQIGTAPAGWIPDRQGWNGSVPAPAWTGRYQWRKTFRETEPRSVRAALAGVVVAANDNVPRTRRIEQVLGSAPSFGIDDFKRLQQDTLAWTAADLVPLLDGVPGERADVDQARRRLLGWDRRVTAESADATLFVLWERSLLRRLVAGKIAPSLVEEFTGRADGVLVPALVDPASPWFSGRGRGMRDHLLIAALTDAVDQIRTAYGERTPPWGSLHTALFRHPLAVTAAARQRYDVGPFERPGYRDTVMSTGGVGVEQTAGASFRFIADLNDWDRSLAVNVPGQSELPASAHFADLAPVWAAGGYFPLPFSDAAVQHEAETTLRLLPK